MFLAELNRLWFDNTLYVRPFGPDSDADAQSFASRVVNAHAELRHKFAIADAAARGNRGRDEPWESRFRGALRPELDAPIQDSRSILSDVSLEIQKINVTDILARLRRWVGSPREVKGSIATDGDTNPKYSANIVVSGDDGRLDSRSHGPHQGRRRQDRSGAVPGRPL